MLIEMTVAFSLMDSSEVDSWIDVVIALPTWEMDSPTHSASNTKPPSIHCFESDTVAITTATSSDYFYELSYHHPCAATHFHHLLHLLLEKEILYIQFTLFPYYGITIDHYVAVDCSSYNHFMKTWATISKLVDNMTLSLLCQPCFDCALIFEARGMGGLFIKDMDDLKIRSSMVRYLSCMPNVVRVTFVLGLDVHHLGQPAVSHKLVVHTHLQLAIDYFNNNHLKICFVEMRKEELVDERGAVVVIVEAEYVEMRVLTVVGLPKLGLYRMGFGWVRPMKVEFVPIEKKRAFLLADNREVDDGIEVGIALPLREI
ncbi:hypothetical protein HPP92_020578 [Vanilla planifolia]|uniref:Uncharacterized protein n=1 Tax=Vanilla planifolia TaxID=51239 RepID=A0A835Q2L4_VANPL|nr:hypothetical protein HPP92_020578 [Vanilla planifolia]